MIVSEQTTMPIPDMPPGAVLAKPTLPKRRSPAPTNDAEFDAFYLQYPRPVGKPAALRAWNAARKRASCEEITMGLAAYQFSPDPKFQPHPATWLNQDRFRDVKPDLDSDPYGLGEFLDKLPRPGGATWSR